MTELPSEGTDCHLISESAAPGGCALNSACVLHALGAPVTLAGSAVGNDDEGRAIVAYLEKHGIDSGLVVREGHRTQRCFCLVSQQTGARSFILSPGDMQWYGDELVREWLPRIRAGEFSHVFIQPYVRAGAMRLLGEIQATPAWILIQDVEADDEAVPLTNVVQISLPESAVFTPEGVERVGRAYLRGRCSQVWLTAGARGVGVVTRGEPARLFPAVKVPGDIVDTTGCGDAFRAGAMWALFRGDSLEAAMKLGQQVGAYKAGVWGSHFLQGFSEASSA